MIDIAKCVRIFDPDPSDDFVAKREAAIKGLRTKFLKQRKLISLMKLGSDVLGVFRDPPICSPANIDVIEEAIKKESVSFIREGRDLEMSVCAMAAVIQAIEVGGQAQDRLGRCGCLGSGSMVGSQLSATELRAETRTIAGGSGECGQEPYPQVQPGNPATI